MGRYPTRNGLALSVTELGYEMVSHERRKTSRHHLYFERRAYQQSRVKQIFRSLEPHVQTMWIPEHNELHEDYSPPVMPREGLMLDVIDEYLALNGVINCVREHVTCEMYQVQAEQWTNIRNGA